MAKRSYAILGTGAVGGYYGACLQYAGHPVHFLLRSDYQQVYQQGLKIESVNGNFTLPQVQAYQDVGKMPPCDVVVVALKTTQNHLLPQLLPPIVKENGIVLLLQNGLGYEEQVAQISGVKHVIGGLCFVCSNKVAPGQIRHLDYGTITLGAYSLNYQPCGITKTMKDLATDFESAGIEVILSDDLYLSRWKKLVWNIPYNGLSVVLNATTQQIMADSALRLLVEEIMMEVVLGAKSCQRLIPETFIQTMLEYTDKMKPYQTSMKLDYDSRRPLEIEAILGNPLKVAQTHGVSLPRIEMLDQQLQFLNRANLYG